MMIRQNQQYVRSKKRVMRYVFRENWVMTKYTRVTFWQLESVIGRTQRNMNVR